jgi:hypothetical protein
VHRAEGLAIGERRRETGPAAGGLGQVDDADRGGGAEALHARALVGLQLQQLHPLGLLVGGGHHPQVTASVGEQDAGRIGGEQLDAVARQAVEQIDDVVVVHQRVGEFDERPDQQGLPAACRLVRIPVRPLRGTVTVRCPG